LKEDAKTRLLDMGAGALRANALVKSMFVTPPMVSPAAAIPSRHENHAWTMSPYCLTHTGADDIPILVTIAYREQAETFDNKEKCLCNATIRSTRFSRL
jgi:hypothetical protein